MTLSLPRPALAVAAALPLPSLTASRATAAPTPGTYLGTYTLKNLATGKVLDSNFDGDVYTLQPNGGWYQRWKAYESTFGTRVFVNVATGRCLDSNTSKDA